MKLLGVVLKLFFGLILVPGLSVAQAYPTKPIRLVVGFSPGGGTDVTARLFAEKLGAELGQPVVVENRSGAAGTIAARQVAQSVPDGYELLMLASGTVISAVLKDKPPFDVSQDFTPIAKATVLPLVLVVHPSVPAKNADDLVKLIRANPAQYNYGSDGVGSTLHLAGEVFQWKAGVHMTHVPFKGGSESAVAVASGQVQVSFPSVAAALPLLKSGRFHALAVTGPRRVSILPEIPTLDELGYQNDIVSWYGFLGPKGMPESVVQKLNAAVNKVAKDPEVIAGVRSQGMEVEIDTPSNFGAYLKSETELISQIGRDANIKIE